MNKNKIIMYHYVCPLKEWKGSVPISPEDFEQQIIHLKKHYEIVSPEEMCIETNKPKCVLTFDDATRDQYTYAFPILKKHQVPACFAVMSGPLENGRVPTFHLVHTVLSHYSDEELWNELQSVYPTIEIRKADKFYYYEENIARRYFKYMMNFQLNEQEARGFLNGKVKSIYGSIEAFIKQMYIQPNELIEMYEAGMTLGVHCVDHLPYSSPPEQFYKEEIEPCIRYMRDELGIQPKYYTPAFGGGPEYQKMQKELDSIMRREFDKVFTTVPGNYDGQDFWLKRMDCNEMEVSKL